MNNELTELLKKMAFRSVDPEPIAYFLTRKEWLRARELGWFTFTDEQINSASSRQGLICETQGCLLYIQQKFYKRMEKL